MKGGGNTLGIDYSISSQHVKACVRERATKSILCVRDVSEEEAKKAVDKVFESCFRDTFPFERVPP